MATRKPQLPPAPSLSLAATLVRTITEDAEALATLASKLSAHVAAEGELCDQTTLPASIPVRTYLRACREGLIAGASKQHRRWIASRSAILAWWKGGAQAQEHAFSTGEDLADDPAIAALRARGFHIDVHADRKALSTQGKGR